MRTASALVLLLLWLADGAGAIVVRHDRERAAYAELGARYRAVVGHLGGQVACTLIAPRWALGAAHTVEESFNPARPPFVLFDGRRYEIDKIILHPRRVQGTVDSSADLALFRLRTPVEGVEPVELYNRDDEPGKAVIVVGRGATGTGLTGDTEPRGELLGAQNRIEAVFEGSLVLTFDPPPSGAELEGIGGAGDSGGPLLLVEDGRPMLVGVGSFNSGDRADHSAGRYGTLDAFARVSAHRAWIVDTMASDPPSSLPIFEAFVPAADASALPETPAARAASVLLAAFNAASVEAMADYYRRFGRPRTETEIRDVAASWQELFDEYGRYELLGYSQAGPYDLALFVRSGKAGIGRAMALRLDPAGEHRVQSVTMADADPPVPTP